MSALRGPPTAGIASSVITFSEVYNHRDAKPWCMKRRASTRTGMQCDDWRMSGSTPASPRRADARPPQPQSLPGSDEGQAMAYMPPGHDMPASWQWVPDA